MALRESMNEGKLSLRYQPIVDLRSGEVTSVEALLRHAGTDSAKTVAESAERDADHFELDQFIVHTACRDAVTWRSSGLAGLSVHVNVSAKELEEERFLALIDDALAESGLDPAALQIEITETSAIADLQTGSAILERVKARGVGVWLDDFGTGHSSLQWLNDFRVDGIKLPRELIAGASENARLSAISRSVTALAHELSMFVIAEGVECAPDVEFVRAIRCDAMQGFFLAEAVSANELFALVGRRRGVVR
jgi:EAL domain-containing protein (putative c-di-GMP-specific phosphodiesterase class I)